ncbi:MerR family transcriptional regulator [Paenibacillus sp. AR247]|uniref:MerR family transcriptional regulator n=1 Tax=Paenibacillus sp. AR247 TaxID=1631599 RepID=UPI000CF90BDF|nr:MerR family transcriptional regulator [Paenibacillus sp. AR247]PQP89804.1 hypothetical protein CPT76_17720 [Paenibacillus sp. AR247]
MQTDDKTYLVGEISAATGVTVRTLQHYDNIGLLPTTGRTAGGRRYYTKDDLLCLEQIIFYKSLGLSLQEIRDKVIQRPDSSQIEQILQEQELALYRKIEEAYAGIAAIEAHRTAVAAGNDAPWQLLAFFIRCFNNSSLVDWKQYAFTETQKEIFGRRFATEQSAFDLYHTWRRLALKAVTLGLAGAGPEEPAAQELAKAWCTMVQEATGGESEQADAFVQMQGDRASWPEGDRELFEASQAFIDKAVNQYLSCQTSGDDKDGGGSRES